MKFAVFAGAATLFLMTSTAVATSIIFALYSDLCKAEDGSFSGTLLAVYRAPGNDPYVVVQQADGALLPPVMVQAGLEEDTLTLAYTLQNGSVTFQGSLTEDSITGEMVPEGQEEGYPVELKRVSGGAFDPPACDE